ncbi:N-acetylmuramoyl-L-alanine amidase family protein [Aegicerativicinus sediminis]
MKTYLIKPFVFISLILTTFYLSASNPNNPDDKFVVVLDAGHGGKDPGRPTNFGYKEKDIALKIVLELGKKLQKDPQIKVIYTRTTDVFVDLFDRGKIANKADADLFVSVHCNAHHTQAYGTETYVLGLSRTKTNFEVAKAENEVIYLEDNYEAKYDGFDPNSPESYIGLTLMQEEYLDQSILLARFIEDNFSNNLKRKSRGVKYAGLIVLHQTYMPSVLVETGFITNRSEGDFLNSKRGQDQMSTSIANAIFNYKKRIDQNVGTHLDEVMQTQQPKIIEESDVVFKIQIAAGKRKIPTEPSNFKGLTDVTMEDSSDFIRYYYGNTPVYSEALRLQKEAKAKGYPSCFIVAYKNGEKIDVSEARKSSSN